MNNGEQIREQIEHLMTLTIQYAEDKILRDHVTPTQNDLQSDIQQVKTYILGLEERISLLEQQNGKLKADLNQVGTVMANMTEVNKNLQAALDTKKKKFWR